MIKTILISSLICGLLYRLGGWKYGHKLIRRLGCGIAFLTTIILLKGFSLPHWWVYLTTLGVMYLALTTYHDYLAPDGTSENWLCWAMTGFCYGLSAFPLIGIGISWDKFLLRAIVLCVTTMLWSEKVSNDWLEEIGRGMLIILTLPILLL